MLFTFNPAPSRPSLVLTEPLGVPFVATSVPFAAPGGPSLTEPRGVVLPETTGSVLVTIGAEDGEGSGCVVSAEPEGEV